MIGWRASNWSEPGGARSKPADDRTADDSPGAEHGLIKRAICSAHCQMDYGEFFKWIMESFSSVSVSKVFTGVLFVFVYLKKAFYCRNCAWLFECFLSFRSSSSIGEYRFSSFFFNDNNNNSKNNVDNNFIIIMDNVCISPFFIINELCVRYVGYLEL